MCDLLAVGYEAGAHRAHKASGVRGMTKSEQQKQAQVELLLLLEMEPIQSALLKEWRDTWAGKLGELVIGLILRDEINERYGKWQKRNPQHP